MAEAMRDAPAANAVRAIDLCGGDEDGNGIISKDELFARCRCSASR